MRFLITWQLSNPSEAEQARILALFAKWQPPVELHEWSGFADGSGGMAVADAIDVVTLSRVTAPWTPWLTFTIRALEPIQQTAAVMAEASEFWASVDQ